jgi:hypothetical protein
MKDSPKKPGKIRAEIKKINSMPAKESLQYIWYYYKGIILIVVGVIVALVILYIPSETRTQRYDCFLDDYSYIEHVDYLDGFIDYLGYDNDSNYHNQICRYLLYQIGHVSSQSEWVWVIINSAIPYLKEDTEPISNEFLERNFKNGNRGELTASRTNGGSTTPGKKAIWMQNGGTKGRPTQRGTVPSG